MKPIPKPAPTPCKVLLGNRDRESDPTAQWVVKVYTNAAVAERDATLLSSLSAAIAEALNLLGIDPEEVDENDDATALIAVGRQYDPQMDFGPYDGETNYSYYYTVDADYINRACILDDAEEEVQKLLEKLQTLRAEELRASFDQVIEGRTYQTITKADSPMLIALKSNPLLNPSVQSALVCPKCGSDLVTPNVQEGRIVSHTCLRCGETG